MMNSLKRLAAAGAAAAAITGGLISSSTPAEAADISSGALTVNCSWGSCSYYLSRSATRELSTMPEITRTVHNAPAAVACAGLLAIPVPLGPVLAAGCAGAGAGKTEAMVRSIREAAQDHGARGACFKVTLPHGALALSPTAAYASAYPSSNNGRFCKD